ncbi:glycosyltransferase [Deinococcus sp. Arct2-2]|uniref:glycosyltransferase n=1 Tax=Deinococcus sp. Arct2-2 TaxID=2568653 RepID=UPI0010A32166|nr:glycosyltransferase [Deinococcus sp. Arct2-2]THF68046.1 glycosyltransferase [Deinococcus sp. Arct2-2]
MTRVIHILNELRPSGAETMIRLAAPYWQDMGLKLAVLSTGDAVGPYAPELEAAGISIVHLPFRKSLSFFQKFGGLIRGFDAIHIHTERAGFEYAATARAVGMKHIVRTIHSTFNFQKRTRLVRTVQRRSAALLGVKQVSIGPSVKDNELERFRNPTLTIPNWYNEHHFVPPTLQQREEARATLRLMQGQWSILSVGNCASVKNHEAILHALKHLPDAIYVHAGIEDKHQGERALALELGVLDRVRFLGWADPLPLLWAADVYVMSSRLEGFGIAALEALGTGIPTTLTNVPGLRDLAGAAENLVFSDLTPQSIAAALQEVRVKPRLTHTATLAQQYGIERGAKAYAALYR